MFPVSFQIGPLGVSAHFIFESLGYLVGFRLYLWQRARRGDVIAESDRLWVVAAAIAGAAIGSKLLFWMSDPELSLKNWNDLYFLMGGKTIVGGLIGGLLAVEGTKRRLGIRKRTGDLFAIPLLVGIGIGRVGCFLAGLSDGTHGIATALPWGVDFGDGVFRHPTQIYEVMWLMLLGAWLFQIKRGPHREGDCFKAFMIGYLGFRLVLEFIKPGVAIIGMTAIQWTCLGVLIYYAKDVPYLLRRGPLEATP